MQRLEKILAQTAALKVPEWPSYGNFRKVTQNLHFQKKCKGETKRSFSKIAQKSSPPFKKANSTLAQMTLSSNKYALKVQGLEKILAQKAALKVPKWRTYGNFEKVTQNQHFLKKVQRGDKEKFFQKSPKK